MLVSYFLSPHTNSSLIARSIQVTSVFPISEPMRVYGGGECDRQFSESKPPEPNPFLCEDPEDVVSSSSTSRPSLVLDSGEGALQRLIGRPASEGEVVSLIEKIFSNRSAADVASLTKKDAQTFIDVMDKVCHDALPSVKNRLIDSYFTLLHFNRRQRTPISLHGPGGNACGYYPRCVPATSYFLDHCRSNYATIRRASHCAVVDMVMCSSVNTRGRRLQSRC